MRIAILSDIHSNLAALEAVLADAGDVDGVWSPGDIVGYGPNPNECIDLLRSRLAIVVAGNHDWAAIGRLSTKDFNPDAAMAAHWTGQQLSFDSRRYLEDLPLTESPESEFTIVHGTLRYPIWQYLLSPREADETFGLMDKNYCFVGHTHLPAVFVQVSTTESSRFFPPPLDAPIRLGEERVILNPGSVGQPRDGNPQASYAILDMPGRTAEYRRVAYDIERTQRLMRQVSLPERLIQRLSYGW